VIYDFRFAIYDWMGREGEKFENFVEPVGNLAYLRHFFGKDLLSCGLWCGHGEKEEITFLSMTKRKIKGQQFFTSPFREFRIVSSLLI